MKLARSTYYYRSRRSATEKVVLHQRIAELSAEFPRYGYRRITHQLRAERLHINHKAVARIMRENGLQVRPLRRFVRTTQSDHQDPIFPDLTRGFIPTGTRSTMGMRSDLRGDRGGFRVRRRDPRCLVAAGVRLRTIEAHRYATDAGSATYGRRLAPASTRLHPPFGPWRAVHVSRLSTGAEGLWAAGINGTAR